MPDREFDDLFAALARPFGKSKIKTRPQGGKTLRYITARTAQNRLDDVLGPANWWDDYFPGERSVICRLTIRLPDGSTLTKVDAGGYAGMADGGDDDKSGFSDSFKRAAVKLGIGRYLYGDGVPAFVRAIVKADDEGTPIEGANGNGSKVGPPPSPTVVSAPRLAPVSRPEPDAEPNPWANPADLLAWLKRQDATLGIKLVAYVRDWIDSKGLPSRASQWTPAQTARIYAAAREAIPGLVAATAEPDDLLDDELPAEAAEHLDRLTEANRTTVVTPPAPTTVVPPAPAKAKAPTAKANPVPVAAPSAVESQQTACLPDRPPTTGKALFAWLLGVERDWQTEGLVGRVNEWGKRHGATGKMVTWSEDQVAGAVEHMEGFLERDWGVAYLKAKLPLLRKEFERVYEEIMAADGIAIGQAIDSVALRLPGVEPIDPVSDDPEELATWIRAGLDHLAELKAAGT